MFWELTYQGTSISVFKRSTETSSNLYVLNIQKNLVFSRVAIKIRISHLLGFVLWERMVPFFPHLSCSFLPPTSVSLGLLGFPHLFLCFVSQQVTMGQLPHYVKVLEILLFPPFSGHVNKVWLHQCEKYRKRKAEQG